MKSKYLVFLLIILSLTLSAVFPLYAYSETFTTGKDWTQKMSNQPSEVNHASDE